MGGVWFFLILLPTSSLVPMADPIIEHRLCLPLAGLAALVVVGVYALVASPGQGKQTSGRTSRTAGIVTALAVVVAAGLLGRLTHQRNKVYASQVAFWQAAADGQKLNERQSYRTESQLGNALVEAGRTKEGADHLLSAMRVDSTRWETPYHLARALMSLGRHADAFGSARQVTRLRPQWAEGFRLIGECQDHLDKPDLAVWAYQQALERDPTNTDIRAALERAKVKAASQPPPQPTPAKTRPVSRPSSSQATSPPTSGAASLPTSRPASHPSSDPVFRG